MTSVSQIKLFTHNLCFLSCLFDAWFDLQLSSTFLKVACFTVAAISPVCILSCIFSCDLNGYILISAEFCESSLSGETEYACPAWLVTVSSRNRWLEMSEVTFTVRGLRYSECQSAGMIPADLPLVFYMGIWGVGLLTLCYDSYLI